MPLDISSKQSIKFATEGCPNIWAYLGNYAYPTRQSSLVPAPPEGYGALLDYFLSLSLSSTSLGFPTLMLLKSHPPERVRLEASVRHSLIATVHQLGDLLIVLNLSLLVLRVPYVRKRLRLH